MSNEFQPEQHEMQLEKTHPSGAEEWCCPTCGRRFLMQWPPAYKKIILEIGDEYALHSGGKGGLRLSPPQVSEDEEPLLSDELRLAIEEALKNVDFDDWSTIID
ncbi:MAG: hypothetical protein KJ077_19490 [Anaerolineae bacterium]|nr:hypothetical protein [Anaerolineae bacterium]GIK40003.1 MAG: hypothetical protein BroJett011_38360 [Chloroflexota bacterium]